ncbi:Ribokinase-like protein [Trametes versicolor FP-101664 SS1]|uniref:Ribokinase-like protein n=1 Tax=Trametes versicolor (strain FP-101664) TaxID=717944 RepID=UPI0004622F7E|nr:Ribokinase-like protein [Trametes versicolor FP-101664 SS1]EIW61851.1 Ribokinase-like protein [Trametes versicolor FP-101664 SS1]
MSSTNDTREFVSLGMFIIDEFTFVDDKGEPTGQTLPPQIGGGGTYAAIGARIWLPPSKLGMIIDRGNDFPSHIQGVLDAFGSDMWLFRDNPDRGTARARNSYQGESRGFEYLTPRIRITPRDLVGTRLARPRIIHFICSPERASAIMAEVKEERDWYPITVYEPIPFRCVPEELPALQKVLSDISVLSPNAEEAFSLLSMPLITTKELVEEACCRFLEMGVGPNGTGHVIVRSGALGACIAQRGQPFSWIDAYWSGLEGASKVVDVTGAGNSFLGGLAAGLVLSNGDVREATLYATVSASFVIEQEGLPRLTQVDGDAADGRARAEQWNGDSPLRRVEELQRRLATAEGTK